MKSVAVPTSQLRIEIERVLQDHFADSRRVRLLLRRESPYRSSFHLEELAVHLDDGTSLIVVFKHLSEAALSTAAGNAKPNFLYDPMREITAYELLAGTEAGTAVCYGTSVDPTQGRFWLFLEKVEGTELYDVGDFDAWKAVARWLGRFQSRTAPDGKRWRRRCHLLHYDADYYRIWPERALAFSHRYPQSAPVLRQLASRYEHVVERLVALPMSVLHGEFYASNVLVRGSGTNFRVCPIDWEMAAWGAALVDLAALCSGEWGEEERRAMALEYRASLDPQVFDTYSEADLLEGLDACRMHLAMQWLGWSENWTAPPEQAHDWLGEATAAAQALGRYA
jgi:hypothetical protein